MQAGTPDGHKSPSQRLGLGLAQCTSPPRQLPTPPVPNTYPAALFGKAASEVGFNPYPQPCANCSEPYTNFYGVRLGPCNLCGFCERFGCYLYSKGSPQTTILPALLRLPNFEMRTQSWVQRINVDSTGKKATGVTYIDLYEELKRRGLGDKLWIDVPELGGGSVTVLR